MKFNIILIVCLLSIFSITQGQVRQVTFINAVDYLNYKSVELSLNKSSPGILEKFESNCKCKENPEFFKIISAIPTSESLTIDLSKEINLIKNDYTDFLNSDQVVKLLTIDIFSQPAKYNCLFKFADKRIKNNKIAFEGFKNEIRKQLEIKLSKEPPLISSTKSNPDSIKNDSISSSNKTPEPPKPKPKPKPDNNDESWFDGLTFQIDIFSIILSVLIVLVIFKIKYRNDQKGSDLPYHITKFIKGEIKGLKDELNGNPGENSGLRSTEPNKLKEEIYALKEELRQLRNKIESLKNQSEITPPKAEQGSWLDTKPVNTKSETFYLSNPNADGSFNDTSATISYNKGATIYKFNKFGNNKAKFQIDEREDSVKLALDYPDKAIDPVCDALNAFNSKANRIVTVEAGVAELVGDKWVVDKFHKAKIRYES